MLRTSLVRLPALLLTLAATLAGRPLMQWHACLAARAPVAGHHHGAPTSDDIRNPDCGCLGLCGTGLSVPGRAPVVAAGTADRPAAEGPALVAPRPRATATPWRQPPAMPPPTAVSRITVV